VNGPPEDPLQPRSETILRPTPGGGARAPAPTSVSGAGARAAAAGLAEAPRAAMAHAADAGAPADFIAAGRNRLLAAAGPLLTLGARLQSMVVQTDPEGLRRQSVEAVRSFEALAGSAGVEGRDVTIARYLLCTFVDSAVFRTPWGVQVNWARQPLLLTFHQEVVGGEKFFEILERLKSDAARHVDLLELVYVCLALGFEGKYYGDPARLTTIRAELQATIASVRGIADRPGVVPALSPHWQGVRDARSRLVRWLPWWVVALAGCVVLAGTWIVLRHALADAAAPLRATLASQSVQLNYEPAPAPEVRGRLRPLLAADEAAQRLRTEQFGERTVITLLGESLFASGSAMPASDLEPLVGRVAAALARIPGAVMVVGHTDDQPLRSLRYASNFDLSRARALAVAQQIRAAIGDPARVEWTGLGETEPRYLPPENPGNRARNRRVEIIHTAGSAPDSAP